MTPWQLAKVSEHSQQRALFAWANCVARFGFSVANSEFGYTEADRSTITTIPVNPVPELSRLFAIHNQGHGDAIRGAKAKAEGVKPGVPDIMLPVPMPWFEYHAPDQYYYGLFVEMKKEKGGVLSLKQNDWIPFLQQQGYAVSVCHGWIEAANAIENYMTGHMWR